MIAVGLDPGVHTGYAVWDVAGWRFRTVQTLKIHRAFEEVIALRASVPLGQLLVMFEDARKRGNSSQRSAAMAQGAGSVKRDSKAWHDFLDDHAIPYTHAPPLRGATKWTSEYFARVTGWAEPTSEHARDAACRVWQLNKPQVLAMLGEWQQRRHLASLPKPRKVRA